ncbi:PDZ domain-containing protein [Azonexus caeni]|jgi:hypothetical protein|uniref:PDZ domain-containing protein n=1 Tax=Azonexus caeni TaxID=266126 RepID=UPI003A891B6B
MQRIEITSLAIDGQGARAGLKTGDILLSYNNHPLDSLNSLLACIDNNPNSSAVISLLRGNDLEAISVNAGKLQISVETVQIDDNQIHPINAVRICLTSGETIEITELLLADAKKIAETEQLITSANEKMKGWSSPIGFLGSPGWVLTGLAATSVLERVVSGGMANEAITKLHLANEAMAEVRRSARFVPISEIKNIRYPSPNYWSAKGSDDTYLIHSGDNFLIAKSNSAKEISLIIDHIVSYETLRTKATPK